MAIENNVSLPSDVQQVVGPKIPNVDGIVSTSAARDGIVAQITDNPFFTGVGQSPFLSPGLGLAGLGAVLAVAQRGLRQGAGALKRRYLVDLNITVKDNTYPWFLHWMTIQHRRQQTGTVSQKGSSENVGITESLLRRFKPRMHHLSIETSTIQLPNGAVQTRFALIPGPGRHILRYKKAFILVNRVRETKSLDRLTGTPFETITLMTLYSQRHIFQQLISEAHEMAQRNVVGKTIVYTPRAVSWEPFGKPQRKRPLESVILDEGVKENIVADVKAFLQSDSWYSERGLPYRRGYLLHGTPGSGKTSFIKALAGELDYGIAVVNLSERGLTDDRLSYLLTVVPQRTLILLEDVDVAFTGRIMTDEEGYRGSHVTFAGLLNALDGVMSSEERVMFFTTNHIEKLDTALIRPGRVDMTVRLGEATRYQAGQLWERFYGDIDQEGTNKIRFLEALGKLGVIEAEGDEPPDPKNMTSTAALQGLFLFNKGNMDGAIAMASQLKRS
ncbi:MAG: hypothetical protein Q9166_002449 [cf. Caloplaca sp. 2 TL-2023]